MKYLIHILITINQKAFRLGPEVQCRVSFHSMISDPGIHARGVARGQNLVHLLNVVLCLPPEGLGDILFFPGRPSVRLSVCHKSCPLCNSKTPEAIFTKLHTNINQH